MHESFRYLNMALVEKGSADLSSYNTPYEQFWLWGYAWEGVIHKVS